MGSFLDPGTNPVASGMGSRIGLLWRDPSLHYRRGKGTGSIVLNPPLLKEGVARRGGGWGEGGAPPPPPKPPPPAVR